MSKTDARKIDALDQWCLRMLLGIRWYQFVRNYDVRRLTKQPKLTAIIQSRQLTLFGHIMRMDDNADAKRILSVSPSADWRRQLGRPCTTWLSSIQQDLKHHHLTLPEAAADLAQNRPLWRMMSTYGATQSWVARQKRWRRRPCRLTRMDHWSHARSVCSKWNSGWHSSLTTLISIIIVTYLLTYSSYKVVSQ